MPSAIGNEGFAESCAAKSTLSQPQPHFAIAWRCPTLSIEWEAIGRVDARSKAARMTASSSALIGRSIWSRDVTDDGMRPNENKMSDGANYEWRS
jgi:hypothetical protein